MLKNLAVIVALFLCAGVAGCAPTAVPFGASVHWGLGGFYWTWTNPLEQGCVAWMAKDRWASVQLLINSQCEGQRELGYLSGAGIDYLSSSDEIVFRGYWPKGEMRGGGPCPHVISEAQITELRALTAEALAQARTAGERRVLRRIDERLSVTSGDALMMHHGGWCSDLTQADWHAGTSQRQDVWQGGR